MALGIYVHWPFCRSRCPYCDFNAHVWRDIDQPAWREALLSELRHAAAEFDRPPVESVFFGGGTPSLMPPATVSAILELIAASWGLIEEAEITLEANPGSSEAARFRAYAEAGVNRISVGVQSLRNDVLSALGRTHTAEEARRAVRMAQEAVPRSSLDLITARPGQTVEAWETELAEALTLRTEHLSIYQLTFEPGTPFTSLRDLGRIRPLDEGTAAEIYEHTAEQTAAAGLPAYEVSNHARPGAESRHNLIYWRGDDWIGVGPGAHGRPRRSGRRIATEAIRDPAAWLAAISKGGHGLARMPEDICADTEAQEYVLMALRLAEGLSLERFREIRGRPLPPDRIEELAMGGLLSVRGDRLSATDQGRLLLNRIVEVLDAN